MKVIKFNSFQTVFANTDDTIIRNRNKRRNFLEYLAHFRILTYKYIFQSALQLNGKSTKKRKLSFSLEAITVLSYIYIYFSSVMFSGECAGKSKRNFQEGGVCFRQKGWGCKQRTEISFKCLTSSRQIFFFLLLFF